MATGDILLEMKTYALATFLFSSYAFAAPSAPALSTPAASSVAAEAKSASTPALIDPLLPKGYELLSRAKGALDANGTMATAMIIRKPNEHAILAIFFADSGNDTPLFQYASNVLTGIGPKMQDIAVDEIVEIKHHRLIISTKTDNSESDESFGCTEEWVYQNRIFKLDALARRAEEKTTQVKLPAVPVTFKNFKFSKYCH